MAQVLARECPEDHDLIDTIEELGAEVLAQVGLHALLHLRMLRLAELEDPL